MKGTPWSRIIGKTANTMKSRRLLAMEKANGQCSKGDNCSSRHDKDKCGNRHSRILLQDLLRSRMWKIASGTRSPRGRSPSGRMSRLPCKDYLKGTCTTPSVKSGILQSACSTSLRMDADSGKSALTHTARLTNSLAWSLKRMVTKLQWPYWRLTTIGLRIFRIWSRRSLHRFCGRAQTYWSQFDVFNSLKPWYVMLTFETKIHRLE